MKNIASAPQDMSANVMVVHFDEAMNINLVFVGQIKEEQFNVTKVMSSRHSPLVDAENIRQAVGALIKGRFHALPVIDGTAKIVGAVSSSNLIQYLGERLLAVEDKQ